MPQIEPSPLTKTDRALVVCIRLIAWCRRAIHEAKDKQVAEQASSQSENNPDPMADTTTSKEKCG
jgi:hypothetical protein